MKRRIVLHSAAPAASQLSAADPRIMPMRPDSASRRMNAEAGSTLMSITIGHLAPVVALIAGILIF